MLFKLESLDEYDESGDPTFDAFCRGEFDAAQKRLEEFARQDAALHMEFAKRGTQFVRTHVLDVPLSKYLEFEFLSYRISACYDERILIVDRATVPAIRPSAGRRISFFSMRSRFSSTTTTRTGDYVAVG